MHLQRKFISYGFLISFTFWQCQTKSNADKSSRIDTTIILLKNNRTLSIDNIRELNIVDTVYSYGSKGEVYCDTTVHLTNNIFYSIISLSDTLGICSHYFVLTINVNKKKAIASQYLGPACDIDFSVGSYQLYDHIIVSKDSILLRETTIYQKKNRTSMNENENIERKETKDKYLLINQAGEIITLNKTTNKNDSFSFEH